MDFVFVIIGTLSKEQNGCKSGYPNYLNVFIIFLLIFVAILFAMTKKNNNQ